MTRTSAWKSLGIGLLWLSLATGCGDDSSEKDGSTSDGGADGATGDDDAGDGDGDAGSNSGDGDGDGDACDPNDGDGPESFYVEVESIQPVAPYTLESSKAGFFGTGYFQWPHSHSDSQHGIDNSQSTVLEYVFDIGQPGAYMFGIHGRRDKEGWCDNNDNGSCNDVWVKFDDDDWTKKMVSPQWGNWGWDDRWDPQNGNPFPTEVELCAGQHTVSISGRSNGVAIDALRLFRKDSTPPDGQ